jgi:hypothetical protein
MMNISTLCNKRELFDPNSYCVLIMFIPFVFIPAILIHLSKYDTNNNYNIGFIVIFILFLIFNSTICSLYKYNEYLCSSIALLISMSAYILINTTVIKY